MTKISNLYKIENNKNILNNINLVIEDNSIVAILGDTRSGKTILSKIIAKIIQPNQGTVDLGKDQNGFDNICSIVYDTFEQNTNMNVFEYLKFYICCYDLKINSINDFIDDYLSKYNLTKYKYSEVDKLDFNIKKILNIIRCLLPNPNILILDSIMNNTNNNTKEIIKSIIKSCIGKMTIIFTCDNLLYLGDIISHVVLINNGSIVDYDSIENILYKFEISNQIEIKTNEDNEQLVSFLKCNKNVDNIIIDIDRIIVSFLGDKYQLNELLKQLLDNDFKVYSFKKLDINTIADNDAFNKIIIDEERFE